MGFMSAPVARPCGGAVLRGVERVESRGRRVALVVAQAGHNFPGHIRAASTAEQLRSDITSFPGEDAPGTGRRVTPNLAEERLPMEAVTTPEHQKVSSADLYASFPAMMRASCPLDEASLPDGPLEPEAGPRTGKRVPPARVAAVHTEDPHPAERKSTEARKKAVDMRHNEYLDYQI